MEIIDGDKIECSRCETVIPLEDAVNLKKETNRTFNRPLCEDCLAAVAVPSGYELERDITYLKR